MRLIRGLAIALALMGAATALVFLTRGQVHEVPAAGPETVTRHPNGLVALVPEGASVEETADGFTVEAGGERTPLRARLVWEPRPCDVIAPVVREMGTGSGGTGYEMTTRRPLAGGCLSLTAQEQTGRARPGFGFGLRLFQTARMERGAEAFRAGPARAISPA